MQPNQEASTDSISTVCPTCAGDTLLRSVGIQKCIRCHENFCLHFASKYDPRYYCLNCLKDLELKVDEDFLVEREVYSWRTDSTRIETKRCTTYSLSGDGYLFAQRAYQEMSEADQEVAMEYHRQMYSLISIDHEMKRMEKLHRLAEKKASPINLAGVPPQSTTHTRVQKTTTTKTKTAKAGALDPFLQAAFKAGLTPEDLMKMLAKGAGGSK